MSYQVFIKPAAQRQLKKLTLTIQKDLIALIESLSDVPRPLGCKKLKGRQNQYRDLPLLFHSCSMQTTARILAAIVFAENDKCLVKISDFNAA